MKQDTKPIMVSIHCLTYNHAPYIRQCLEGFVMQKTNFRFEAIVHDDASTDGTASIIREFEKKYPDIIKPIYESENQYSKRDGSLDRIMDKHMHGKYIAFCEGDDYWLDEKKLQKQVDFLEMHPDFTMAYSAFKLVDANDHIIKSDYYSSNIKKSFTGDNFFKLLKGNYIQTATICIKGSVLKETLFIKCPVKYDYTIILSAAALGKLKFFNTPLSCYRMTNAGAMGMQASLFLDYRTEVLFYFAKIFLSIFCGRFSFYKVVFTRINLARIFRHYKKYKYAISMFSPY